MVKKKKSKNVIGYNHIDHLPCFLNAGARVECVKTRTAQFISLLIPVKRDPRLQKCIRRDQKTRDIRHYDTDISDNK